MMKNWQNVIKCDAAEILRGESGEKRGDHPGSRGGGESVGPTLLQKNNTWGTAGQIPPLPRMDEWVADILLKTRRGSVCFTPACLAPTPPTPLLPDLGTTLVHPPCGHFFGSKHLYFPAGGLHLKT